MNEALAESAFSLLGRNSPVGEVVSFSEPRLSLSPGMSGKDGTGRLEAPASWNS